jgi:hypothetical protein
MTIHLYYRVVEEAVFAPEDVALENHRIHEALETSRTWGDLKDTMPPEAYEELIRSQFDEDGEPRPAPFDIFNADKISGYSDGDYPPWLQPMMDQWIPRDLLTKYGSLAASVLNGNYWVIPASNVAGMVEDLRLQGFVVTERPDLKFY